MRNLFQMHNFKMLRFGTLKRRNYSTLDNITNYLLNNPITIVPISIAGLGLAALATRYQVCKPNQQLVKTGLGIRDMQISKKGIVWPFQRSLMVDLNPSTYTFRLLNMSKEKVEFELPIVMTIGPFTFDENPESFEKYCKLLQDMSQPEIENTIKGLIEGETRVLTAALSIEEMFNSKDVFREKVADKISPELENLGLKVYNANIQEMKDYNSQNKYFEYRKQRAIEMANNEARKDVSEAQKQGDVAVSERQRDTRVKLADNEKQAKVEEYLAKQETLRVEAEMNRQEAETQKIREVSLMEANQTVELRKQDLQREIEEKKYEQIYRAQRSITVAPANAEAEAKQRLADAHLYSEQKNAEALLVMMTKKAEGIQKTMDAQAQGIEKLLASCNGNPDLARFYLGNDSGLWRTVVEESAKAVQNMQPNVTSWQTGPHNNVSDSLTNLAQGLVPMYSEVKKYLETNKK